MKKTIALILMLSTMLSLFGIGMHTGAVSENVLKLLQVGIRNWQANMEKQLGKTRFSH